MDRSAHIDTRAAAIDRLVRAGRAAMPDASQYAPAHLGSLSVALAEERGRHTSTSSRTASGRGRSVARRRRYAVMGAVAAFVALPSLAMAGVLPDPVQRVAATVAGAIGVEVPDPKVDDLGSVPVTEEQGSARDESTAGGADEDRGSDRGAPGASTDGRGADDERGHVNGDKPGKPEDGEQRGNRYGQVPEGPDKGKAGQESGSTSGGGRPSAKPSKPASKPTPATPKPKPVVPAPEPVAPAPSTPAPTAPAPAPTPTAPSGGGGQGGGNGQGNGR